MPAEIFEKKNDLKHTLNSDDRIYKLIRDDHIQKSGKPEPGFETRAVPAKNESSPEYSSKNFYKVKNPYFRLLSIKADKKPFLINE